ncbi:MAG: tetratricopeptide repeat protein [Verrucomicrobiota bacterium]
MRRFLIIVALAGATACSRSPSKSFETGLAYFKDDDFARAAVCFEQALKTGTPTAQLWNFLGASRLQNSDIGTAIAAFQEALKLDASHNAARYNLAAAYLEAKQPAQAIPLLRQLAQAANCPPSVHLQLGRAYIQDGDWLKAKPAFEKLSDQNTAEIQNALGVIETHLGNARLAKTHLEAAARLDLQHATARQNLAILEQYYLAPKPVTPAKPAEQIAAPTKLPEPPALAAAPLQVLPVVETPKPVSTPPATPKTVVVPRRVPVTVATLKTGDRAAAKTFFNDGIAKQQQTKLPAAIAAYAKAIAADPAFAQAYYNLGIAYRDSNQPDKAFDNYELALAAQPDFRDARFNYAILLQQQGFIVDALAQYEKILDLNPNEPSVRLTAATLYARDPVTRAKARQHYDAYLRIVPNSPMARDIRDWLDKNR